MADNQAYCKAVQQLGQEHKDYHDNEYGFPIHDDNALFGRLILEINQAGLSWTTILRKKDNFYDAYDEFDIQKVAQYEDSDRQRLLSNAGIIRNKLKVNAAIHNAQVIQTLQEDYGSFESWLNKHHPLTREEWVKLFRSKFKFVGGEIVNEFLLSTGYLQGAHEEHCPIFKEIVLKRPMWMVAES